MEQETPKKYEWFWKGLDKYLERHQLKQTKQREKIVKLFLDIDTHMSAESLHVALKDEGENIGLATIYRTLNLLADAGLAVSRSFQDGKNVYEILHPDEHHDHLVCLDCGEIIEFENEKIEELQTQVAKQFGFDLVNHRLDLFGRCQKRATCPKLNQVKI